MTAAYRRRLAAVSLALLVALAGCTGVLVDRAAAPAVVPDADRLAAGYEAAPVVAVPVSVPIAVGPVVREVRATGTLAVYTAPERESAILVLSTPDAEVAGESVNPLVRLTDSETVEMALDAVREAGTDALFSSFLPSELARLRDLDPATDRALLVTDGPPERAVDAATELGCVAVHPPIDVATGARFVERAHEAGLAVNAWTVTDREDAERLLAAGVDGIIADRWDLLSEADSSSRS